MIDNSTQKKAPCTKKKTHGRFYRLRSFVPDDLDVKNPKESDQKDRERPEKKIPAHSCYAKVGYLVKDIVEGVDDLIVHGHLIMKMRPS